MRKFVGIIKVEALLFVRNFFGFFFTFAFPLLMLLLYGGIYGNEPTPYFNGQGTIDVSVPAYSAMIIGVTGLMAFPLTVAGYKENNIYKRFDATPAGKGLVITAQAVVNVCMTVAGFGLLFAAGTWIYHLRIAGSFLPILLTLVLSIASIFSIGFFFTAVAPNEKISSLLCYVSYFVMLFLSGSTMPKEMFPEGIRNASKLLPLTHVVDVLQASFRGAAFSDYRSGVFVLLGVLLVCTVLGALFYKRKNWA